MNATDFLDLADDLVVGDGEAEWRSAVSRAYYAAFHRAREFIEACGFQVPQSERAHTYLAFRLMNCGDAQLVQVGRDVAALRTDRNRADYEIYIEVLQSKAANIVYNTINMVRILEEYTAEPARFPALATAILAYERDVLREITYRGAAKP